MGPAKSWISWGIRCMTILLLCQYWWHCRRDEGRRPFPLKRPNPPRSWKCRLPKHFAPFSVYLSKCCMKFVWQTMLNYMSLSAQSAPRKAVESVYHLALRIKSPETYITDNISRTSKHRCLHTRLHSSRDIFFCGWSEDRPQKKKIAVPGGCYGGNMHRCYQQNNTGSNTKTLQL